MSLFPEAKMKPDRRIWTKKTPRRVQWKHSLKETFLFTISPFL